MTRPKKRGPGRPKGSGSNGARVDLQVPPGLKAAVVAAAKAEGIPAQEFWRRAARAALVVRGAGLAVRCERGYYHTGGPMPWPEGAHALLYTAEGAQRVPVSPDGAGDRVRAALRSWYAPDHASSDSDP